MAILNLNAVILAILPLMYEHTVKRWFLFVHGAVIMVTCIMANDEVPRRLKFILKLDKFIQKYWAHFCQFFLF